MHVHGRHRSQLSGKSAGGVADYAKLALPLVGTLVWFLVVVGAVLVLPRLLLLLLLRLLLLLLLLPALQGGGGAGAKHDGGLRQACLCIR